MSQLECHTSYRNTNWSAHRWVCHEQMHRISYQCSGFSSQVYDFFRLMPLILWMFSWGHSGVSFILVNIQTTRANSICTREQSPVICFLLPTSRNERTFPRKRSVRYLLLFCCQAQNQSLLYFLCFFSAVRKGGEDVYLPWYLVNSGAVRYLMYAARW